MWLTLAFVSAALLGFYDVAKKHALGHNAVLPVLLLNTLFSSLIFLPFVVLSALSPEAMQAHPLIYVPRADLAAHGMIALKSAIVLTSWVFGYFGMKHLPLTIVGPINATRPVLVLLGAMLIFGERLNPWQWAGILLGIASLFMLSLSGKKEGIDFRSDKWIFFVAMAAVAGAASGLYDKYLMRSLPPMLVQSWYTVYQLAMMGAVVFGLWWPQRQRSTPFEWRWSIPLISLFLCAADFAYFYSLSLPDSMISVVSMIRRGSVVVSFGFGAMLFRERNIRGKALDLVLVLLGLVLLWWGSRG